MSKWDNQEEWNARMLEALVNIYTVLNKHEVVVDKGNTEVTDKIMLITFETGTDGKVDETKRREEPQYDLWTQKDFDNMRKAIPYADPAKVETLLKALTTFRKDQDDTLIINRKGAWEDFVNIFNDATINSQCNYSTIVLGSITNLLQYFGKRTGFQAQTMDRIDHAMEDRVRRTQTTKEESGTI